MLTGGGRCRVNINKNEIIPIILVHPSTPFLSSIISFNNKPYTIGIMLIAIWSILLLNLINFMCCEVKKDECVYDYQMLTITTGINQQEFLFLSLWDSKLCLEKGQ